MTSGLPPFPTAGFKLCDITCVYGPDTAAISNKVPKLQVSRSESRNGMNPYGERCDYWVVLTATDQMLTTHGKSLSNVESQTLLLDLLRLWWWWFLFCFFNVSLWPG